MNMHGYKARMQQLSDLICVVCRAMLPELLPVRVLAQPVLQEEQGDHPPR